MTGYLGKQIGNYRLIRLLGSGGFADVYLGEHVYLHTQAAIKLLQARLSQESLASFLQEAQMIARLDHPNIVRVLDFGLEEQTPFLVMTYAPNGTLRQRHPAGIRLPLAEVIHATTQIAEALHYAHERKIIHRDIKPENMLIGQDGTILLSDFGIAVVSQSSRYQGKQNAGGTVAYMAPEQLQGKAGSTSDQYALGIVVYEWLTGQKPFNGSFAEIGSQHLFTPPPSLLEQVPGLPPRVEQVIFMALKKDPHRRFPTVKAFADALLQAWDGSRFSDAERRTGLTMPDTGTVTGTTALAEQNIPTEIKTPSSPVYAPSGSFPNQPANPAMTPPFGAGQAIPTPVFASAQTRADAQRGASTPTSGLLASTVPVQPHKPRNRRLIVLVTALILLLIVASSVSVTAFFLNHNNRSQASNSPNGNPTVTNAQTPTSGQDTPVAINAPATPTSASSGAQVIHENLHLTCLDGCTAQIPVTLDTIVMNDNSTMELHFTIKNESTSVCSMMFANTLYLEDPAGNQTQGGSPGTFTQQNDLNARQTFQEYATFQLTPVHGTPYTLHIQVTCGYLSTESFQIETFTF